jgi:hypothetical protein
MKIKPLSTYLWWYSKIDVIKYTIEAAMRICEVELH